MATTDTLLRTAIDRAKPVLGRFGILSAPVRDAMDARRVLTFERPLDEVSTFLAEPTTAAVMFVAGATVTGSQRWDLAGGGTASASLRQGPGGATEVLLEVHLSDVAAGGRPRYTENAGVVALRALHRAKALLETGEYATLEANPAGRSEPDPYGDRR